MPKTQLQKLTNYFKKKKIVRTYELEKLGIHRRNLAILEKNGIIARFARGMYVYSQTEINERYSLAHACKLVPRGVICLLSSLQFHNIGTQLSSQIWIAIPQKTYRPKEVSLQYRFVEFSEQSYKCGVEKAYYGDIEIRIYNSAKTVVDCFKFRNKIGLDVAIEALKDYFKSREASIDDLIKYARICRVEKIITPYIEALS